MMTYPLKPHTMAPYGNQYQKDDAYQAAMSGDPDAFGKISDADRGRANTASESDDDSE